jgi:sarcosine oxidase subunit beta
VSDNVIVIGAGVIGASIAYHLAREGSKVTMYDNVDAPSEPSASWASAGGVRSQDRDPREWKLTISAAARWSKLGDELQSHTGFRSSGHLHVAEKETDVPALRERIDRERAAGIGVEYVEGEELRKIAPGLARTVIGAAYTPRDGQADPRATTYAFAKAAVREGVTYVRKYVERIAVQNDEVVGVVAGGETQAADATILAAGSWSMRLAAAIGLTLPVKVRGYQMVLSMQARRVLQPTITAVDRPLTLTQLQTGGFLIGGGWATEIDEGKHMCRTIRENIESNWALAETIVPTLGETMPATAWCGLEGEADDGVPLIGPAPKHKGLFLAVGFSGHGFQIAPAVGEAVATAVRTGTLPEALRELSPS